MTQESKIETYTRKTDLRAALRGRQIDIVVYSPNDPIYIAGTARQVLDMFDSVRYEIDNGQYAIELIGDTASVAAQIVERWE